MLQKVKLQLPLSEITKQQSSALISQVPVNSTVYQGLVLLALIKLSIYNRRAFPPEEIEYLTISGFRVGPSVGPEDRM